MTTISVTFEDARAEALRVEATRRNISVEELVRQEAEKVLPEPKAGKQDGMKALEEFWKMLPKDYVPPTDEEVERILDERRMRKYIQ